MNQARDEQIPSQIVRSKSNRQTYRRLNLSTEDCLPRDIQNVMIKLLKQNFPDDFSAKSLLSSEIGCRFGAAVYCNITVLFIIKTKDLADNCCPLWFTSICLFPYTLVSVKVNVIRLLV